MSTPTLGVGDTLVLKEGADYGASLIKDRNLTVVEVDLGDSTQTYRAKGDNMNPRWIMNEHIDVELTEAAALGTIRVGDKVTHNDAAQIYDVIHQHGDYVWLTGPRHVSGFLAYVEHVKKFVQPIEVGSVVKYKGGNYAKRYKVLALYGERAWIIPDGQSLPFTETVEHLEVVE